jgi:acetyl esterase/lipase
MRLSVRARALKAYLRHVIKARSRRLATVGEREVRAARRRLDALARRVRAPADLQVLQCTAPGVRGEWLCPREPVLGHALYLHGGAYALGSARLYRGLAGRLAAATRCRVLVPDYRLAPEHPFPAALDDAIRAWRVLLESSPHPVWSWLAGDSAGGGLALALAQQLAAARVRLPGAIGLISPWVDLAGSGESVSRNAERDHYLSAHLLGPVARLYLQGADPLDPRASPLFGNMQGLPRIHVHVCESEILRDDGLRVVERVRALGGDATLRHFGDLPHVFHAFAPLIPEAETAIRHLASQLEAPHGDARRDGHANPCTVNGA